MHTSTRRAICRSASFEWTREIPGVRAQPNATPMPTLYKIPRWSKQTGCGWRLFRRHISGPGVAAARNPQALMYFGSSFASRYTAAWCSQNVASGIPLVTTVPPHARLLVTMSG